MKNAVAYHAGNIFQHFGYTAQFKLYVVKQDKIVEEAVLSTNGSGYGCGSHICGDRGCRC